MNIFEHIIGKKDEAEALKPLNEEKRDMIRGVVDLSETSVKEVMVPRIDVAAFPVDMPEEELLASVSDGMHSRFPVYRDSIDNVVGVLYVKDLIRCLLRREKILLEALARKPFLCRNPSVSTRCCANLSGATCI